VRVIEAPEGLPLPVGRKRELVETAGSEVQNGKTARIRGCRFGAVDLGVVDPIFLQRGQAGVLGPQRGRGNGGTREICRHEQPRPAELLQPRERGADVVLGERAGDAVLGVLLLADDDGEDCAEAEHAQREDDDGDQDLDERECAGAMVSRR